MHQLSKVSVFLRVLKRDQVHASLATKVPSIEPIPVLKLIPWLPPRKKVVVLAILLMIFPILAHVHPGLVKEWSPILSHPGLVLSQYNHSKAHYQQSCLHVAPSAVAE